MLQSRAKWLAEQIRGLKFVFGPCRVWEHVGASNRNKWVVEIQSAIEPCEFTLSIYSVEAWDKLAPVLIAEDVEQP